MGMPIFLWALLVGTPRGTSRHPWRRCGLPLSRRDVPRISPQSAIGRKADALSLAFSLRFSSRC
jgi:hypothetical protein